MIVLENLLYYTVRRDLPQSNALLFANFGLLIDSLSEIKSKKLLNNNIKKIGNLLKIQTFLVKYSLLLNNFFLLLDSLTEEQKNAICNVLISTSYKPDDFIVTQGDSASSFFIIKQVKKQPSPPIKYFIKI